jgi:hypothetical protein
MFFPQYFSIGSLAIDDHHAAKVCDAQCIAHRTAELKESVVTVSKAHDARRLFCTLALHQHLNDT